jgi:hypothetical protein
MTSQRTAVSRLPEPPSDLELKRLRAYEGLAVFVIAIAAVLLFGSTIAVAVTSSLGHVANALGPAA